LAEGVEVGRIRSEGAVRTASLAGDAVSLRGGPVSVRCVGRADKLKAETGWPPTAES
jgi:hypothetical protein